jgi:DNA-binding response OmpR family regulator
MAVLLVDDDRDLIDVLTYILRREGYEVLAAYDGEQGWDRFQSDQPELVVLDANMPGLDGMEVCRRIREVSTAPVIMLTARTDDVDKIVGLELGADDYVTKPFSAKVLAARMKSVLARRNKGEPTQARVQAGDLVLDLESHEVTKGGVPAQLTPLEFRILYLLAMNEGRVIPYSRLVEYAWGYYDEDNSSLLKTHICHLRKKLGLAASKGHGGAIKAILGVGYSLNMS